MSPALCPSAEAGSNTGQREALLTFRLPLSHPSLAQVTVTHYPSDFHTMLLCKMSLTNKRSRELGNNSKIPAREQVAISFPI